MKSRPNITRMDYERTKGWYVRIAGLPPKLFSDSICGGMRKALKAAEAYRDTAPPHDLVRCGKAPSEGRVYRLKEYGKDFWGAYIRVAPGKMARTKISIAANGPRKAKSLAQVWLDKKRVEQQKAYAKIGVKLPLE